MRTYQDWLDAIGDLVYSLFGAGGQLLFQEYALFFMLGALALAAGAGVLLLRLLFGFLLGFLLGAALRKGREAVMDFPLLGSRDGRRVLRLARQIRRGSRRLRRLLVSADSGGQENRALLGLLERFARKDLPEALAQAHSFIEPGGAGAAAALEKTRARQEQAWAEMADGERRNRLEREIAETRQRLLQARQSNDQRAALLKGLEEAALALRTLEVEMASLEAARSSTLSDLRDRLNETAEGLHHQREVHEELRKRS